MQSVMQHSFAEVPRADVPRSSFNRSHGLKTTFDADYLIPILVDDIVPGDTFNVNVNIFARLATPVFPIMDNMYLETFFFFVPYRLLWTDFEKFHGSQVDPGDSIDFTIPALHSATTANLTGGGNTNELRLYMGLPWTNSIDLSEISALPFRAYAMIWNDWFRDQNLQDSIDINLASGNDASYTYELKKRGKRHDYFTSCLPSPQKGDAVDLPIAAGAATWLDVGVETGQADGNLIGVANSSAADSYSILDLADATHVGIDTSSPSVKGAGGVLGVDLSSQAATINDLRLAFQTQRLLERDARSGTRYNEMILAHYGVTVPDFRVQRPEFLGGGSSAINITPVAQTTYQGTPTDEDAKGSLAGFGTVSGRHGFTKSFTEHGVLIGLANVRGDVTYSQGIERYFTKSTRYDFYYPVLSQIGEQSVLNKEIYHQNNSSDELVFGYQERYAEMRYKPSRLTGLMAVDRTGSLSAWHLSEDFGSLPTLGSTFIESNTGTPLDRAIAVNTEPHFIADFYFDMKCARPMPLYGVPGNLDHF